MKPENLSVVIGENVAVDVVEIESEFDTFHFTVDKTSFPKVRLRHALNRTAGRIIPFKLGMPRSW